MRLRSLLLPLALAAGTVAFAQQSEGPHPPAATPNEVSMRDVCSAAVPETARGLQFHWNPNSTSIGYFKPLETGSGLQLELDSVPAAGGESTVLVTGEKLDQLFPATFSTGDGKKIPAPKEKIGFEWGPNGDGLLLHSSTNIVWLDRKAAQFRSLVSGKEPVADVQLSPDGRWAAFVRDHNVWIVPVAGGAARAITREGTATLRKGELDWLYPAELGTRHGYTWSPDSSRIAYLEFDLKGVAAYTPPFQSEQSDAIDYPVAGGKNPQVRVLIAALNEKVPARVVETGAEKNIYLPRLQWLPDSRNLAVERLNRAQNRLDLLIADARTGASHVILTENDAYWINLSDILYFFKSGSQFLWSSERSGYRHLYLYDGSGKLVRQLTDGKWEVTSLDAVDEGKQKIYFTSTENSSVERQVYVTSFEGGSAKRVSSQSGTHQVAFAPDASAYIDNFSTATKPWARTVYRISDAEAQPGSTPVLATRAFTFALGPSSRGGKAALRQVDFLSVKTHDGVDLNAMMVRPSSLVPGKKYPSVVYIAGGPGEQAAADVWNDGVSMWLQYLAQHGYIVFAVDNRGTAGRGHVFEEYLHYRFEAQEMIDLRDAVGFLQSLPYIDPARTGLWGGGFGGALTLNAMRHPPLLFKAGFAVAPVVNWMRYDSTFTERYLGDPVSNQDGYIASSQLGEWGRFKGSLLIGQGLADLKVHPDQTMEIQHDAVEDRKYLEIALFPGQAHAIDRPEACTVLYQRATDFFAKTL